MKKTLTDAAICEDLEYFPDVRGAVLFVKWRRIPVGSIDQVKRQRALSPEVKRHHRGKWYQPWAYHRGFFSTREDAACDLVRHFVDRNANHEIVAAALNRDFDAIEAWLRKTSAEHLLRSEE